MSSGSLLLVFYFKINIVIREHFYVIGFSTIGFLFQNKYCN
jgi:hypothetical protein